MRLTSRLQSAINDSGGKLITAQLRPRPLLERRSSGSIAGICCGKGWTGEFEKMCVLHWIYPSPRMLYIGICWQKWKNPPGGDDCMLGGYCRSNVNITFNGLK